MTAPAARVVHRMAGRTRLRTRGMRGNGEYFAQVRSALLEMSGVRGVAVNPGTESILIEHDVPIDPLLREVETRGYLQLDTGEAQRERYLERLGRALQLSDENLKRETTGRVSFETLAFFGLVTSGIYQVAKGHGLPAGVTLLRYALELVSDAAGAKAAPSAQQLAVRAAPDTGGA